MMIGILQPGYLPWLGFFEQINRSDAFVLYDDVQYDKHSWRNRNRIKGSNGIQWLTVPVHVKFEEHPAISDVRIDNSTNWKRKHLAAIRQSYSKAPFFKDYIGIFEDAYQREWELLVDLDLYFIEKMLDCLVLSHKKLVRSSQIAVENGDRIQRLINICHAMGADEFYEGAAGKNYIDDDNFARAGIRVIYQDYQHPQYSQLYGDFVPYLSIVDLLFNHGSDSLKILTQTYEQRFKV
ncbi:MAG: hypothetical protein GQF41_3924 [Candidatus Rifleibacterium amylolyticum]|nr:MAG: hypothetical protein GQF41_3924 [Candidatus Rifleibacterium amylolyticum]